MIMNALVRYRRVLGLVALFGSAAGTGIALAQTDPIHASLARGWSALASAQPAAAVAEADRVLAISPRSHDGIALKTAALSRVDVRRALDAYDQWSAAARRDDVFVIEPIAAAVLVEVAAKAVSDPRLRFEALEILARAGDGAARAQIAAASAADASLAAAIAGAAVGDAPSIATLRRMAGSPDVPDKTAVVRALAASRDPAAAVTVASLLKDPSPVTRAAAATALGSLGAASAVAALRDALNDSSALVRSSAAVALHQLGDRSGETLLAAMLNSEVADLRLLAATAYRTEAAGPWSAAIKPLLNDPNGVNRFIAAELLARVDPEAARAAAATGLDSANPNIREEAARVVAIALPEDLAALRRLLRDTSPRVRLHAAHGVLKLAGAVD